MQRCGSICTPMGPEEDNSEMLIKAYRRNKHDFPL